MAIPVLKTFSHTALEQIPSALFEILTLAKELRTPGGDQIARLADDVINVSLSDPEAWVKLKNSDSP
ncbi:MAG: hypothetical protein L0220_06660 [Acidobacteria bacterium]|nr:hypothetical protein [Acidobacteriota bacterium]